MAKNKYRQGKIDFLGTIVALVKNKNLQDQSEGYIKAVLSRSIPELSKIDTCPNCDASMQEYTYVFDCLDALLLLKMAYAVKDRQSKGLSFTEANQVRIPELDGASYAIKSRTTMTSKLGLIAQLKNADGKRVAGVWCITARGWAALRGEEVPAQVKVWRGQIEERFDEMITIAEALKNHREAVNRAIAKHKTPKGDYRAETESYSPHDWFGVSISQGNLV